MPKLGLTREQLAKFLPDHQAIRAFEQVFEQVDTALPEANDEANSNAGIAIAAANAALSGVVEIIAQLQLALSAPAPQQERQYEDHAPAIQLGTISSQNADSLDVGSVSASGQITSTLATGTAPLVVASATKVANLNVDLLDGADWASPAAIGSTTPGAGTFTTLRSNSNAKVVCDTPTSQVIATATFVTITNWTERLDVGGDFNAVTGVFTAPRTGVYLVTARMAFGTIAFTAVGQIAAVAIYKGASQVAAGHLIAQAATSFSGPTDPVVIPLSLAAGDTVSARVFQNSGSNVNTTASNDSYLSIIELP